MKKLKLIASYVRLITCLLLHRNFGNTVHDIAQIYENVYIFLLPKFGCFCGALTKKSFYSEVPEILIYNQNKQF